MAYTSVDENYKGDGADPFEKLRYTDNGEVARFMIAASPDPVTGEPCRSISWEWVHTIRAPSLEHGVPVMEPLKKKDGTVYGEKHSTRFVGQRLCLGDPDVLEDKGIDPNMCPGCAAAKRGVKDMRPERRYAVPIIRYETQGKKSDTVRTSPPSAKILVWVFSQKQFGLLAAWKRQVRDLLEISPDVKDFALNLADVVLVCEDSNFQRIRWSAAMRPAHRDPRVRELVKELWGNPENRPTPEQLRASCGRDNGYDFFAEDVDEAEAGWSQVEAYVPGGDPTGSDPLSGGTGDLDAGLDDLLNDGPAPSAAAGTDDPFADEAPAAEAKGLDTAKLGKDQDPDMLADQAAETAPAADADPLASASTATPEPASAASAPAASAATPATARPSEPKAEPDEMFGGNDAPAAEPAKAGSNGTGDEGASFDDVLAGL
jgi:hypothetical protein